MSNHIIITGGLGFIGHNLARYYLDEGYYVTVIDNLKTHHDHAALTKYRIEQVDNKRLNFIQLNCNMSYGIIDRLRTLSKPKTLIHLCDNGSPYISDRDGYFATSTITANAYSVATLAKEISAKVIYLSSSRAYGNDVPSPMKETALCNPNNLYGLLKHNCEMMIKLINPNSIIVRTDTVYGPGNTRNNFITNCIHQQLNNEEVVVTRYNETDPIHVSDLVRGIKNVDDHGVAGETYNLSYSQLRTDNEIALIVKMLTNSNSIISYDYESRNEGRTGILDNTKATELLGFKPKLDVIYGLRDYIDWIKKYDHL